MGSCMQCAAAMPNTHSRCSRNVSCLLSPDERRGAPTSVKTLAHVYSQITSVR